MEEMRAADEGGGQEAASRSGDQSRRAAEELDEGEERWRRGELHMREEDRKLHRAVESKGEMEERRAADERGEEAASRSG